MSVPYYRNTGARVGAFTVGELTRAMDDSAAFFDGPAADSAKQSVLEKMVTAANLIVTPLRRAGYSFTITRSYSEGAANHGAGDTFDLSPGSKDPSDCYDLAIAVKQTGKASQVWIEASDDEGNFHVHVKASATYNSAPDERTILNTKGVSVSGLKYMERTINSMG